MSGLAGEDNEKAERASNEHDAPAERRSGDAAVEVAAERAKSTGARNISVLPDLPLPEDTANLRQGPDLNHAMLALIPLVGVWRGEGEGHHPADGDYRFGQQIIVSHDGGEYLVWESQTWRLDSEGNYASPDLRESGYWRVAKESSEDEMIELLLTHSNGVIELYYGKARNQSSWELATDVSIRTTSGVVVGGAKRLYGIVDNGDLAYVEERVGPDGALVPRLSARLARYIG